MITAAAAIMAAVFGCFLVADVLELKEFGFALAVAVVLDATLIRLILVPAIMKVAGGGANWWLPGWLGRILPRVQVGARRGVPHAGRPAAPRVFRFVSSPRNASGTPGLGGHYHSVALAR